MSNYRTAANDTDKMPPGIPFIIGNEAAERFSFYGMRTILVIFMTKYLWLMGDALRNQPADGGAVPAGYAASSYQLHGLQGTPLTTSYPLTAAQYLSQHVLVDLDGDTAHAEQRYAGDVDVFRHAPLIVPNAIPACAQVGSNFTLGATLRDFSPHVVKPLTYQWYRIDDALNGVYTARGTAGTISSGSSPNVHAV